MAVSAFDSRIFRNLFGTQEIRDVFTDEAYVRSLIEVEAALARAEAAAGVIPADAGKAITDTFASLEIEYVRTQLPAFKKLTYSDFLAMSASQETQILSGIPSSPWFCNWSKEHPKKQRSISTGAQQHRTSKTMLPCFRSNGVSR